MINRSSATSEVQAIGRSAGTPAEYLAGPALFPFTEMPIASGHYHAETDASVLSIPELVAVAPGGSVPRIAAKIAGLQFDCHAYRLSEAVPKEQLARYGDGAKRSAARRTNFGLSWHHDLRCSALAIGPSVPSASPSTKWDQANSDPVGDVGAARQAIYLATGLIPKTLILPFYVYEVLKLNASIVGLGKPGNVGWRAFLAAVFDVDNLVVAGGAINSAGNGTVSLVPIWGDSVILAYVDATGDIEAPSFGRTFFTSVAAPSTAKAGKGSDLAGSTSVTIDSFEEPDNNETVIRASQLVGEVLTGASLGYHLSNTLAAV